MSHPSLTVRFILAFASPRLDYGAPSQPGATLEQAREIGIRRRREYVESLAQHPEEYADAFGGTPIETVHAEEAEEWMSGPWIEVAVEDEIQAMAVLEALGCSESDSVEMWRAAFPSTAPFVVELIEGDDISSCTLQEFLVVNSQDPELCERVQDLEPDESIQVGGGAAALVTIRRRPTDPLDVWLAGVRAAEATRKAELAQRDAERDAARKAREAADKAERASGDLWIATFDCGDGVRQHVGHGSSEAGARSEARRHLQYGVHLDDAKVEKVMKRVVIERLTGGPQAIYARCVALGFSEWSLSNIRANMDWHPDGKAARAADVVGLMIDVACRHAYQHGPVPLDELHRMVDEAARAAAAGIHPSDRKPVPRLRLVPEIERTAAVDAKVA